VRIGVGSDEELPVVDSVIEQLTGLGHEVERVGQGKAWPEVGRLVGEKVACGSIARGVVCCWTGTGVSIAANKVSGVRAALCVDAVTAAGARRWNDANVLALSLRLATTTLAKEIVLAFMETAFDPVERSTIARIEEPSSAP
jgi:ribose 5-phosphate isomerase B